MEKKAKKDDDEETVETKTQIEEEADKNKGKEQNEGDHKQWCKCNGRPTKGSEFMIECSGKCENWFHCGCVEVANEERKRMEVTKEKCFCEECRKKEKDEEIQYITQVHFSS